MGRGIYYNDFLGLGKSFVAMWEEEYVTSNEIIAGLQIALAEIFDSNDGHAISDMSATHPGCIALDNNNLIVAGFHQDEEGSMVVMVAPRDDPRSLLESGLTPLDLINNIRESDAHYSQYDVLTDFCLLESDLLTRTQCLVQDISDYLLVQLMKNGISCGERANAWVVKPIQSINDRLPPEDPAELDQLHETLLAKIKTNLAYLNRSDREKIAAFTQEGRDYLLHEIDNNVDTNSFGRTLVIAVVNTETLGDKDDVEVLLVNAMRPTKHYESMMVSRSVVEAIGIVDGIFNDVPITTLKLSTAHTVPNAEDFLKNIYSKSFNGRNCFMTDIAEMEAAGLECANRHANTFTPKN